MAVAEVDYLNGGGSKGVSATFTGITTSNPIVFDCGFIPKYVCIGSMHSDTKNVGAVIDEYVDGTYYETTIWQDRGWRNTTVTANFSVNGSTVSFAPPDGSWASSYSFCATEEYLGNQ